MLRLQPANVPGIDDLLVQVKRRLTMLVAEHSLELFDAFARGYEFVLSEAGVPAEELFLPGFQEWVCRTKYGVPSTPGWCRVLAERTNGNDEAVEVFWRLFEEYRRIPDKSVFNPYSPNFVDALPDVLRQP